MARRTTLTEEQCVRLAEWWAAPLAEGKPPTYVGLGDRVKAEFNQDITQKTIERYVKRAFQRKHLQVRRNLIVPEYQRAEKFELQLQSKWQVRSFVVVDSATKPISSNTVHAQLGYALSDAVERSIGRDYFPDGCRIGIGSGRAVHGVVNGFLRYPPKTMDNAALFALTGSIYPHYIYDREPTIMEADANIQRFLPYFATPVEVNLLSSQIAYEDIAEPRQRTWLRIVPKLFDEAGRPRLDLDLRHEVPTHSLVGVGVFHTGHRLYDYIENNKDEENRYFSSIFEPLKTVFHETNALFREHGYLPLGDLCNRFFVIDPPSHLAGDETILRRRDRLEAIIDQQINPKLMTAPKTLLRQIPNNALIAGTVGKAQAVRTMLERRYVRFNVVCVDLALARRLL